MEDTPTEEPPRAPSAQAQVEEAPVNIFVAEPLLTGIVNLKETFTEELPMSASPAPTAVAPPTPTTLVVPNKGEPRPRKSIHPRAAIKLRPSRPKKDRTRRVGYPAAEHIDQFPVSNVLSRSAGSSEDCFFYLVASVEDAILGSRSAPKSPLNNVTVDQLGSPMKQARSDKTVEHHPRGSTTHDTNISASVITALNLHLPFLSLLSKRGIPERYGTSQTFCVPKTHEPTSTNTTSGDPHPTRTDQSADPIFFYWDLMYPAGRRWRPVRVQPDDADVAFWIIGARYRCNDCTGQQRKDRPKADPSYVAWDERIMSQLPDASRKEFPARTLRQWADPRPAKSSELLALSRKWLLPDSTTLDGFSNAPQDIVPAPGSPLAEIHATDPAPLPTPGSPKRSCGKCLQAACKGNRTIDLCANACSGCKRFSCAKAHREGRNVCLESGPEVQSPSPPKPWLTDLENWPRRDRNREINNRGTEEEKEEKSVEEVLGLI
ncbi:hypothetical protein FRC04_007530 [Tulasnella sp. 424]|nr:hypothetical protein FRC04_007530 [Tulasnella sp. 424]